MAFQAIGWREILTKSSITYHDTEVLEKGQNKDSEKYWLKEEVSCLLQVMP